MNRIQNDVGERLLELRRVDEGRHALGLLGNGELDLTALRQGRNRSTASRSTERKSVLRRRGSSRRAKSSNCRMIADARSAWSTINTPSSRMRGSDTSPEPIMAARTRTTLSGAPSSCAMPVASSPIVLKRSAWRS